MRHVENLRDSLALGLGSAHGVQMGEERINPTDAFEWGEYGLDFLTNSAIFFVLLTLLTAIFPVDGPRKKPSTVQ